MPAPSPRISIIIPTKNEEKNLPACLNALQHFDDIYVVDSNSTDKTTQIAKDYGTTLIAYTWDKKYPKKYQWCLDNVPTKNDMILFVDADEIISPELSEELLTCPLSKAGYFIRAKTIVNGTALKYGLKNNKLSLLNKTKMKFPIIRDLPCPHMGEIEGHYQPVLKQGCCHENIGQLRHIMAHNTIADPKEWLERHTRYAHWEVFMDTHNAWPKDPAIWRRILKTLFKSIPWRAEAAFMHSYILKCGFLDGANGLTYAKLRYQYYKMIRIFALNASKAQAQTGAADERKIADKKS